jgi:cyclopropane fatty-acyl-phospholipid synthase-like methyltransferase
VAVPWERDPNADELSRLLTIPQFSRSAAYDPRWVMEHVMGPHVLWLTEYLAQSMDLRPGMRVLDMGCGKAISSIFLAHEFRVQVWATDLWIAATDNRRRIADTGLEGQVFPVHAEAHALPFADDFFDAAMSMDAYHYFGTDDLYLATFLRFVRPGSQVGIVVPGVREEFGDTAPPHLLPYWYADFASFHSPDWWRRHWSRTGLVDIEHCDWMPDGARLWRLWNDACADVAGYRRAKDEADMLRADTEQLLGFVRLVARRRAEPRYRT